MSADDDARLTAAAQVVATHAAPLFLLALLVVLASLGLMWWGLRRLPLRRWTPDFPGPVFVALHLGVGFALVAGAALAYAEILEEMQGDGEIGRFDDALAEAMRRSVPAGTLQAFAWITRLADTATLAVLCVAVALVLLVRGRRMLATAWVMAVGGNALLNVTLKGIFERVRPVHEHELIVAGGWSFPSGHSSGAVVAYGMLAYVLLRTLPPPWPDRLAVPLVLGAVTLAMAIGYSRMVLQVHYASDVLAGFISGAVWLAICISGAELARRAYVRRGAPDALAPR
jgi:membrane-associated phospholipid phosphatase